MFHHRLGCSKHLKGWGFLLPLSRNSRSEAFLLILPDRTLIRPRNRSVNVLVIGVKTGGAAFTHFLSVTLVFHGELMISSATHQEKLVFQCNSQLKWLQIRPRSSCIFYYTHNKVHIFSLIIRVVDNENLTSLVRRTIWRDNFYCSPKTMLTGFYDW